MSIAAEEIEVEIKRLPGARYRAALHSYRGDIWRTPETRLCPSERDALRWVNARMAIRGFAEPYDMERLERLGPGA